ncbi:putative Major facilitator superfamily (MFS) profile domain-containing protein [Seiridium cardinale]
MGGGTSIWASVEWGSDPREIFNGKLFYLAVVALAGCSYSFDQGNIGGSVAFAHFKFAVPDSTAGTPAGGLVGIIWIYIYAFGWSFGWSVAPYVVAAEISPARIRSFSMSVCFLINWIVDYGITKATPLMMTNTGWGTFLLYVRSIRPMWKHTYPTEDEKVRHDVQEKIVQQVKDEGRGLEKKDTGPTVIHDEESA